VMGVGGGRSEEVQCNIGASKVKWDMCVCVSERGRERFLSGISIYIDQQHQGGFWNGAVCCILL
jgi:hypothetical protein